VKRAGFTLRLWARYSEAYGGIIDSAADVPSGEDVQVTLVMLKPDNFRYPSLRAGNIIDILSRSGLRIVGAKRFAMSKEQAERFYGPVRDALRSRFADIGAERAAKVLAKEFGFDVEPELCRELCARLGPRFADIQFRNIVDFITGDSCAGLPAGAGHKAFDMHSLLRGLWTRLRGVETRPAAPKSPGAQGCLALVYEGVNAVQTIREILGPTDPSKAAPGSVRREFGSDIMVNAAHASDSAGNARREMQIINIKEDTIGPWVQKYYGKTA
jgi:nucleoside diphosphate kinase